MLIIFILSFISIIASLGIPRGQQDTLKYSKFVRHFNRLRNALFSEGLHQSLTPPLAPPLSVTIRNIDDNITWNTPVCSMSYHFNGKISAGPFIYGEKGRHRNSIRLLRDADGKEYAVKIFCSSKEFETEISALSYIGGHENIVKPICILEDRKYSSLFGSPYPVLVMEYVEGDRSTYSIIKRWNEPYLLQKATFQVLSALRHLHSFGLVHGDLKPENILINLEGDVKVIDFGFTHHISEVHHSGTPTSMAPEMISFKDRNQIFVDDEIISLNQAAQDYWALGSTIAQWASVHSAIRKIMSLDKRNRQRIFDSLFPNLHFDAKTFNPSTISSSDLKILTKTGAENSIKWVPVTISTTYEFFPCHPIGIHYKDSRALVSDFQYSLWLGAREIVFYLMNPDPTKRNFISLEQYHWLMDLSFWNGYKP